MKRFLKQKYKQFIAIFFDFNVALLSLILAFYLRLPSADLYPKNFLFLVLTVSLAQSITFYLCGFYKGIWRYSSTYDLIRIIRGSLLAVAISIPVFFMINRLDDIPRSIFAINWFALIMFLGGGRLIYRMYRDGVDLKTQSTVNKKILIIGAGAGGEQILREIKKSKGLGITVVGFLDDDPSKQKRTIHGVPILGKVDDLGKVINAVEIELIYIAIPSASGAQLKSIFEKTKSAKVKIQTLPRMRDILHGKIELSQFRNLDVEDIIGRKEVSLEMGSIASMIQNKKVLITGAGGSIGSELVKQVAKFSPTQLILIENSEFNLYKIDAELKALHPYLNYVLKMVDVRDHEQLDITFQTFLPQVVFHAAAYKHVPLVEANPYAGVDTNVRGTLVVANLARKYEVDRFVLISTDKAVNPTNVMGATKRIAEQICQSLQAQTNKTKYMIVRFGNVLGSSGSAIPLFKSQIEKGGPVTITHPEIKRYFMSIPEASQLVIQAGSFGKGGEVFVLDMGEPLKIVDVAKQMISLAGLKVDQDIKIEYIGLRPGEKMFEELLLDKETTLATNHPLVKIARVASNIEDFNDRLEQLFALGPEQTKSKFQDAIFSLVPEYKAYQETSIQGSSEESSKSIH